MGSKSNDNKEVKLISKCYIKPKYQLEEHKNPHFLVGGDLRWLSLRYMHSGFLYRKPDNNFNINSYVEKIKQTLSHALVYYYPWAGRLTTVQYLDENACSIHVDCNKGPGAEFIHAFCGHVTVSDIVGHTAHTFPLIGSFFNMGDAGWVSIDGHTRPLLVLQVTELKDGVLIGFTMNHSLHDGLTFMLFVNSLCEIFRFENDEKLNRSLSQMPIFEPYLSEGCNLIQKLPSLEPNEFIHRVEDNPRVKEKIFHFSASSISNLKKKTNSEWLEGLGKISSYQALTALVWISINRAKKEPAQSTATCIVPVDCRSRLNPPLSPAQFGNLVLPLVVSCKAGELVENGLGRVAMMIQQGVLGFDHNVAAQNIKAVQNSPYVISLEKSHDNVNMTNFAWGPKLDIYGVDFGLGSPVATPNGPNFKRDGMVVVKAARDGGGSIDLELCLCTESMIALESDPEFMEYVSS